MGAVVVWVAGVISRPPVDNLYETGILKASGISVWYKSFASEDGSFKNEFLYHKLCGDSQKPCSTWRLAGVTTSDRPYPAKDLELHEGGGSFLIQMPDGHAMKGSIEGAWVVEAPAK